MLTYILNPECKRKSNLINQLFIELGYILCGNSKIGLLRKRSICISPTFFLPLSRAKLCLQLRFTMGQNVYDISLKYRSFAIRNLCYHLENQLHVSLFCSLENMLPSKVTAALQGVRPSRPWSYLDLAKQNAVAAVCCSFMLVLPGRGVY